MGHVFKKICLKVKGRTCYLHRYLSVYVIHLSIRASVRYTLHRNVGGIEQVFSDVFIAEKGVMEMPVLLVQKIKFTHH